MATQRMARLRRNPDVLALPSRLEGRALTAARAAWMVVVVGSLGLAAAGMVRAFDQPEVIMPEAVLTLVAGTGITMQRLILAAVVSPLIGTAVVGGIVFWRRSSDPMALLFTTALILLFVVSSRSLLVFAGHPVFRFAIPAVVTVALVSLVLVLGLFPNGRFEPRWTVVMAPAFALLLIAFPHSGEVLMRLPDIPASMSLWPTGVVLSAWALLTLLGLGAQVHRYRHVSDSTQRLQTKWALAPIGLLFAFIFVVVFVPGVVLGVPARWVGWGICAAVAMSVVVPPMLANAVLRYRLYAIDRIISRTVGYGLVVTILGAVYAAGVVGVGSFLSSTAGNAAVAASTLAVAALFRPVQRFVQERVDRRFNRTGYDARRSVETFSHGLRDEVDLAQIGAELLAVSSRALQPSRAAVWLTPQARAALPHRPTGRGG